MNEEKKYDTGRDSQQHYPSAGTKKCICSFLFKKETSQTLIYFRFSGGFKWQE